MKAVEQSSEVLLEPGKSLEIFIVILFAIDPSVNASPNTRRKINHPKVTRSDRFVEQWIRFGKKVAQFDLGLIGGDAGQSVTNSSGCTVMSFSKAGGEDEYPFFHNSLGKNLLAKAFGV